MDEFACKMNDFRLSGANSNSPYGAYKIPSQHKGNRIINKSMSCLVTFVTLLLRFDNAAPFSS